MAGFFLTDVDDYFTSIEDAFSKCRGKTYRTSPKDWALISEWEDKKIPLHIIVRAIEDCFKAKPDIYSLGYVQKAVEKTFGEYQASQVGKTEEPERQIQCTECNDLKEVWITPANAKFDWVVEAIPCPQCL